MNNMKGMSSWYNITINIITVIISLLTVSIMTSSPPIALKVLKSHVSFTAVDQHANVMFKFAITPGNDDKYDDNNNIIVIETTELLLRPPLIIILLFSFIFYL